MNTSKITLPNGQEAIDLSPSFTGQLAIVDLNVIKRLAKLLPKAKWHEIVEDLVNRVRESGSIEGYVDILSEELAFHQTINVITTIERQEDNKPFNV